MPFRSFLLFAFALGVGAFSSGCATIVKGTTQDIPIASEPAGARVIVDGNPSGTTPAKVTLSRKKSHMVTLEKEDYETENIALTNSIGGAVAGNIIAGGLIGWGVDAATGAQYNLHPETIMVRLRPKAPAAASTPTGTPARIASLSDELGKLDEMKKSAQISDAEYEKLRAAVVTSFQAPPSAPAATP